MFNQSVSMSLTMKYHTALYLLFVLVYPTHNLRLPDQSWAQEVFEVSSNHLKNDSLHQEGTGECGGKIFSCQECRTSRVCSYDSEGNMVVKSLNKCPEERPWCDPNTGSCTKDEPPSCGENREDFVCLQKNQYFPSSDCNRFYFCDENYSAKLLECKPNTQVFNPNTQLCEEPSSKTSCGTFNCNGNAAKKVKHSKFQRFYALCNLENADSPYVVLNICPEYYLINERNQTCEPDCSNPSIVNIPDVTDCHKFYTCKKERFFEGFIRTVANENTCPPGLAYDPKQHMCVDESTVMNCHQKAYLAI